MVHMDISCRLSYHRWRIHAPTNMVRCKCTCNVKEAKRDRVLCDDAFFHWVRERGECVVCGACVHAVVVCAYVRWFIRESNAICIGDSRSCAYLLATTKTTLVTFLMQWSDQNSILPPPSSSPATLLTSRRTSVHLT